MRAALHQLADARVRLADPVEHRDGGARRGQRAGVLAAEAAVPAGDDRDVTVEAERIGPVLRG
jgi:hypothetical protein